MALKANPGGFLVTLALSNNSIGSAGAVHLARSLYVNFTLKTLFLRQVTAVLPSATVRCDRLLSYYNRYVHLFDSLPRKLYPL